MTPLEGKLTATKVGGRKMIVTIVKTIRYLFKVLLFCASRKDRCASVMDCTLNNFSAVRKCTSLLSVVSC
jgi:hypothetical protein